MKRLLALLLTLGLTWMTAPALVRADDEKKTEKKDDGKKEEGKKDDGKKEEGKKEEKKDQKKEDKKADDKDALTDAQKEELKKITGTFEVVLFERDGEKYSADKLKKMKVVQNGADYSFHDGGEITLGKDTLYPDKNPKECNSLYLNNTAKGKVVKGIYKIENDTITFCWADPMKDRPKQFATTKDSGLTLMTLKKVSEKKEAKKEEKK